MITRTSITAHVTANRVFKEAGEIKQEQFDISLPKCDTREKADVMLSKEFKGDIVEILTIEFEAETRRMSDDAFYEHSEVVKKVTVSEEELKEAADKRKKN